MNLSERDPVAGLHTMSTHQNPMNLGHLERRKAGRIRCSQTMCQFGPVGDLSRTGCRVISRKPLRLPEGASVNLRIEASGSAVVAPASPVSCKKRGDGKYDIGFRFNGLPENSVRELLELVRSATHTDSHLHRLSA